LNLNIRHREKGKEKFILGFKGGERSYFRCQPFVCISLEDVAREAAKTAVADTVTSFSTSVLLLTVVGGLHQPPVFARLSDRDAQRLIMRNSSVGRC
jgi:hypothetical protein